MKFAKTIRMLMSLLCLVTLLSGISQAAPALQGVGPVDPVTTIPVYYTDSTGMSLMPCLDQNGFCILPPPFDALTVPTSPITTLGPINDANFPGEAFYYSADNLMNIEAGELAKLSHVLEYAFLTGVIPNAGITFLRTDLQKMRNLAPLTTYKVTYPYGTFTFSTDGAGNTAAGGGVAIRLEDVAGGPAAWLPPLMQATPITNMGTWLKPASGILPTAIVGGATHTYIGDAATAVAVIGAPSGNNFFKVERLGAGGVPVPGAVWQNNGWILMGRVFTGQIASPLTINRVTYARDVTGAGTLDAFVTALPTAFVNIAGTGLAPATFTQDVPNTGKFFAHLPFTALPTGVAITNSLDIPAIPYPVVMEDEVIISAANYNPVARTLTVKANSRDDFAPLPALTVPAFAAPNTLDATGTVVLPLPLNTIPPMTVTVVSSHGGTATAFVSVVVPPPAPVAVADAATTNAGVAVSIPVLANDTTTAILDPATVAIVAAPLAAQGTAAVNTTTGAITFTPALGFTGPATFTYDVMDNFGQVSNAATVTVTVNPVAPAPVAVADAATTVAGTAVLIPVLANDTIVAPGVVNAASVAISTAPLAAQGTAVANLAGGVTFTPALGFTGAATFAYTVANTSVPALVSTPALVTVTVTPAGPAPLLITNATLANGATGAAYTQTLAATGGVAPYTWAVAPLSALPAGLTLSAAGVLSGTPTAAGTFTFSLQVTDSQVPAVTTVKAFIVVVTAPPALVITNAALANGATGSTYLQTLAATGGTAPYTWAVAPLSTLPAGLAFTAGGVLSGIPTAAGTFTFSLQVTDSQVPAVTTVKAFTVIVTAPAALVITNAALANGVTGTGYTQTLAATGGSAPYTWAVAPLSTLPAGLTFTAGGVLSGIPTAAGTFTFSLQVTDSQIPAVSVVQAFTVVIAPAPPAPLVITTTSPLAPYTLGAGAYPATTLAATGGTAPYTWTVAGVSVLPAGLTLTGNVLSGTPTTAGTFTFSLLVTDSQIPAVSTVKAFTLVVSPAAPAPIFSGLSIVLNGGALATNLTSVTATLAATSTAGAVTQMQFSTNGGATYSALEPFVVTRAAIKLTAGQGTNTVLVRFRDVAGNLSAAVSDSIIEDTTKPNGTITVLSPNPTTLLTGTLGLAATDNLSGVVSIQLSTNNGANFFAVEPFVATRVVSLPLIGANNFTVRFIDGAGNISGNQSVNITRQ